MARCHVAGDFGAGVGGPGRTRIVLVDGREGGLKVDHVPVRVSVYQSRQVMGCTSPRIPR